MDKIKFTKKVPAYTGAAATLKQTGCGCYIIYKDNKPCYVGMSRTDLKKTLYRHFQEWNDRRSDWTRKKESIDRITYFGEDRNRFKIAVCWCKTPKLASILEAHLIFTLKPKDNSNKLMGIDNGELAMIKKEIFKQDIGISDIPF